MLLVAIILLLDKLVFFKPAMILELIPLSAILLLSSNNKRLLVLIEEVLIFN